ncbi:MAG: hypothetical protein ACRDTT_12730 [Pseudonocardiaceae bacterium]
MHLQPIRGQLATGPTVEPWTHLGQIPALSVTERVVLEGGERGRGSRVGKLEQLDIERWPGEVVLAHDHN